ncbi:MAG TPA: DUF6326 family protein [Thermoanaerobaculia bacterium]|nr:DUF6326 family protein [Thermoanaerobaculia bacterium]
MAATNRSATPSGEPEIPVRLKLSALWTSVMFCYIYGDYFWLYAPGKLQEILAGRMEPLGQVTEGVLLGTTVSMTIPSLMIFLSLVLRRTPNRWLNIVFGIVYSLFVLITMQGAWAFYLFLGTVDIALTLLIVWYAWRWPRVAADATA